MSQEVSSTSSLALTKSYRACQETRINPTISAVELTQDAIDGMEEVTFDSGKMWGWIYMLTEKNQTNCGVTYFQVGKSRNLEETIKRLQNENKKEFMYVWQRRTIYENAAEFIIEKQLNKALEPRKDFKFCGKNWYRGRKEDLINVIDVVIDAVEEKADIEYLWLLLRKYNPDLPQTLLESFAGVKLLNQNPNM